jgi:hypothetical protein
VPTPHSSLLLESRCSRRLEEPFPSKAALPLSLEAKAEGSCVRETSPEHRINDPAQEEFLHEEEDENRQVFRHKPFENKNNEEIVEIICPLGWSCLSDISDHN